MTPTQCTERNYNDTHVKQRVLNSAKDKVRVMNKYDEEKTYAIGELAREFDITPRSIRFYEEQGLMSPSRTGQNRVYLNKDRVRLKLILRGKRLGFSLAEVILGTTGLC